MRPALFPFFLRTSSRPANMGSLNTHTHAHAHARTHATPTPTLSHLRKQRPECHRPTVQVREGRTGVPKASAALECSSRALRAAQCLLLRAARCDRRGAFALSSGQHNLACLACQQQGTVRALVLVCPLPPPHPPTQLLRSDSTEAMVASSLRTPRGGGGGSKRQCWRGTGSPCTAHHPPRGDGG